jgi:hypothetical protein
MKVGDVYLYVKGRDVCASQIESISDEYISTNDVKVWDWGISSIEGMIYDNNPQFEAERKLVKESIYDELLAVFQSHLERIQLIIEMNAQPIGEIEIGKSYTDGIYIYQIEGKDEGCWEYYYKSINESDIELGGKWGKSKEFRFADTMTALLPDYVVKEIDEMMNEILDEVVKIISKA